MIYTKQGFFKNRVYFIRDGLNENISAEDMKLINISDNMEYYLF